MPGSGTSTQNTNSSTSPWAPQAAALSSAFNNAGTAYNTASTAVAPTNFTAGMTPQQLATFNAMTGYGTANAGSYQPQMTAGTNMVTGGATGAQGALSTLGAFNPTTLNNPQAISDQANQYVAGENIPGQVTAAMLPAMQQVRDATLPQMTSGAAGTGNINSSAAGPGGTAQGVVERGLGEQTQALDASMTGQAYDNALTLASNNANANNTNAITAATAAGGLGNNNASTGGALTSGSISNEGNILGIGATGGAGIQAGNQADLTNQQQQFQSATSSPFASLDQLMQIIGSNNWGNSSSGTSSSTPSMLSLIGGLLGAGGSALGSSGGVMGNSGLLGLMNMSDRNTKDDIVQIGTLFDGQPVYRFRYKGERKVNIGLMAQDVEKLYPEAILEAGGIKYVNYGTATRHIVNAPLLAKA